MPAGTEPLADVLAELDDVWVVYAGGTGLSPSLQGCTLSIRRNEWVAIIGHNGSGKSTLGKVLAGLCPTSKGRLTMHPTATVRMVFQNPETQALGETAWEDIHFQPHSRTAHENTGTDVALRTLAEVWLLSERHNAVHTLSGGQKQRLAIASAVVGTTDLLVLDEVTTMLDEENQLHVREIIDARYQQGASIVWITQNMAEVAFATRVVALTRGRVVFEGSPATFFYPSNPAQDSPCEQLGFQAPDTIQVCRALTRQGVHLDRLPLQWTELTALLRQGGMQR